MQHIGPKIVSHRLPSTIRSILQKKDLNYNVQASGWTRSLRKQKQYSFLELNDGSCSENLQVVLNTKDIENAGIITGTSVSVEGILVKSPKDGQPIELIASSLEVIGKCDSDVHYCLKKMFIV
jgi:asparaginyl-tRNA synthetase